MATSTLRGDDEKRSPFITVLRLVHGVTVRCNLVQFLQIQHLVVSKGKHAGVTVKIYGFDSRNTPTRAGITAIRGGPYLTSRSRSMHRESTPCSAVRSCQARIAGYETRICDLAPLSAGLDSRYGSGSCQLAFGLSHSTTALHPVHHA
jgi:hypothetical protein